MKKDYRKSKGIAERDPFVMVRDICQICFVSYWMALGLASENSFYDRESDIGKVGSIKSAYVRNAVYSNPWTSVRSY